MEAIIEAVGLDGGQDEIRKVVENLNLLSFLSLVF